MKYCIQCGNEISPTDKFCKKCGHEVSVTNREQPLGKVNEEKNDNLKLHQHKRDSHRNRKSRIIVAASIVCLLFITFLVGGGIPITKTYMIMSDSELDSISDTDVDYNHKTITINLTRNGRDDLYYEIAKVIASEYPDKSTRIEKEAIAFTNEVLNSSVLGSNWDVVVSSGKSDLYKFKGNREVYRVTDSLYYRNLIDESEDLEYLGYSEEEIAQSLYSEMKE